MPTHIARAKRTRILYVVLLCIAIAMSTWAIYNQVSSDNNASQLADQIAVFCEQNPQYSTDHFNCQQAKAVQEGDGGIQGAKGDKGDKGEQGPKGDSIMGPPGIDGTNGTNGTNGQNGHDGVNGSDGQSIQGPQGLPGEAGPKGDKGDAGERGADGQPGEDAPRITDMRFEGTALACNLVVTFDRAEPQTLTVPGALCVS